MKWKDPNKKQWSVVFCVAGRPVEGTRRYVGSLSKAQREAALLGHGKSFKPELRHRRQAWCVVSSEEDNV